MANTLPEYRLRLFLSVDLVGSSAFKARNGLPVDSGISPNPAWVEEIARFYRGFPDELERAFAVVAKPTDWNNDLSGPSLWKTIGDEIVFCCRLECHDHLTFCVKAFIIALDKYGKYLDRLDGPNLDLKGYGWVAAFPYPNVTVRIFEHRNGPEKEYDLPDEALENDADINPSSYDSLVRT